MINSEYFETQKSIFYKYLLVNVATTSMVTDAIDVPQKCLTYYKDKLEREGLLWVVKKDYCKKTGRKADYLTTNRDYKPKTNQLTLFDND